MTLQKKIKIIYLYIYKLKEDKNGNKLKQNFTTKKGIDNKKK